MLDHGIVAVYLVGILALGLWSGRRIESMQQFLPEKPGTTDE